MQRTSAGAVFFGKSLKYIGYLSILGLLASVSITTATARERVLIDSGWRFQLGDPGDVTTNVTIYPEISNLAKLNSSDINAETALQNDPSSRPDGGDACGRKCFLCADELQRQRLAHVGPAARLGGGIALR